MPNEYLSKDQIRELTGLVRRVFAFLTELRGNALGKHIQFPKTPTILSESLVVHLLLDGKILGDLGIRAAHLGGGADVIAESRNGPLKIEVKGTHRNFELFYEKDIRADYLVWVDFSEVFNQLGNHVNLTVIRAPSRFLKEKQLKIQRDKLNEKGIKFDTSRIDINSL